MQICAKTFQVSGQTSPVRCTQTLQPDVPRTTQCNVPRPIQSDVMTISSQMCRDHFQSDAETISNQICRNYFHCRDRFKSDVTITNQCRWAKTFLVGYAKTFLGGMRIRIWWDPLILGPPDPVLEQRIRIQILPVTMDLLNYFHPYEI